jgi:hypothetical protein
MRCLFSNPLRQHAPDSVITRGLRIVAFAGTLMGCGTGLAAETPTPGAPSALPLVAMSPQDTTDAITIVAAGDIMPGSLTPIPFLPAPTDHDIPDNIRRVIGQADLVFGNLEGAFTTEGLTPVKCRPDAREARRCFEFGSPPFLVSFLKDAGFTVLSLDNNHAEDYGLEGYALTQGLLAQAGLTAVPKRTPVTLAIRDLRVTVVPFGFSGRSFHVSDLLTAQTVVAEARHTADIVIVSFHGGAEGEDATRVRDTVETYFEEDRGNVIRFAHAVVDAGADLVVGHGPHVPRAIELYKDRLIAYSLGNFWTYGNISIKGLKGIMPLVRVTLNRDGTFVSGRIVSMRQRLPGIPELDPDGAAIRLIATLSREDVPSNPIEVDESGTIRFRQPETADGEESPDHPDIN